METRGRSPAELAQLEQEFIRLYEEMAPKLVTYLTRAYKSRATAEECVQQAFERAWNIWGRDDIRNPQGWISQIASNVARDRAAYDKLRQVPELLKRFGGEHHSPDPQEAAEEQDLFAILSPRDRLIMLWRYRDDLDDDEIAQRVGKSPRTVRDRIQKSREKIRAELIRNGQKLPISPSPVVEGVELQ